MRNTSIFAKLVALAGILFLGISLWPPTAAAANKVVVWHAYRGKERAGLEKVAKKFNSSQSEIAIELLPIPYDAFADKITAAIPRGKGPDLFIFAQDRIGDWAAAGVIESVDFWVDDALRQRYLEPTIEALTYDDTLYGLPIAFKMVALYYNKRLVKKPPTTTDELIAMAKKATKANEGQFGLVYENANFYYHALWMQGFGGRVFDGKGNPAIASAASIDSLKFAQHLAHEAGIMPQEITNTLVTALFNRGKAAMVINGPWFLGEISKDLPFGVAVLPVISASGKPATPFLTAEGVIMSARARDKKAGFEVMKYLTGTEAGVIMATDGRQTTARKEVYDLPQVQNDEVLAVFRKQLRNTVPMPNTPAMRMVWSPATIVMNKVINGKIPPADAAKQAQAELEKLIKGARR